MAARGTKHSTSHRVSKESVAKQFVRLYYNILNTHHEYLHQFYGAESTIVVSEMMVGGKTMTETADTEESVKDLLKSLYAEVDVKVDSSVPQFTVEGSVLLLITGTMSRKSFDEERVFTQALLLSPQENGFYIRTDTVHVLGKSQSSPMIQCFDAHGNEVANILSGEGADGQMSPTTPRTESDASGGMMIGQFSDAHRFATPVSTGSRNDIQTCTPPAHEADPHLTDGVKSSDSEDEHNNQGTYMMGGLPPMHGARPMARHMPNPVTGGLPMPPLPPMGMPPPYRGPMPIGRGHYREMSMSMNMGMAPPPVRAERRRSLSMGSDPRVLQAPPGHGVFIARLPFGIQPDDVAEAFAPFGPILGGADGIQVRDGRNGCYSFVIFENAASATNAIQKGAVVQGKRVYVEPRYPRQEATSSPSTPVPPAPTSSGSPPAPRSGIPTAPRRAAS